MYTFGVKSGIKNKSFTPSPLGVKLFGIVIGQDRPISKYVIESQDINEKEYRPNSDTTAWVDVEYGLRISAYEGPAICSQKPVFAGVTASKSMVKIQFWWSVETI